MKLIQRSLEERESLFINQLAQNPFVDVVSHLPYGLLTRVALGSLVLSTWVQTTTGTCSVMSRHSSLGTS